MSAKECMNPMPYDSELNALLRSYSQVQLFYVAVTDYLLLTFTRFCAE